MSGTPADPERPAQISLWRAAPVFLAFLAMGFADAAGPFVGLAKQQFNLSNFTAQLIAFAGFIMFGVLSVPLGVFQDRKGKHFVLVLGLSVMLAGVAIPAALGFPTFVVLLLSVVLLGAGATILQVAGNPLMRDVSEEGKYSRNLSLAQFVKAIGSLSGPLIPVIALHFFGLSWGVVFPVFSVAIAIALVSAVMMRSTPVAAPRHQTATFRSCLALLKNSYIAMMVLAIFLYVGAEVCVSSGIPLFLRERYSIDIAKTGLLGTGLFFVALTCGRFSGGVVLNWIKPKKFLIFTCLLSILGLIGMFLPFETVAAVSFFVTGLGFANVFPLVFSITVDHMPENANALSGLMITAIVGAAILPPLMGLMADAVHSMQMAFLVPLAAILYVTWAAAANLRGPAAASRIPSN
jgi:FHS family L-fucose permease-like MFS transporter